MGTVFSAIRIFYEVINANKGLLPVVETRGEVTLCPSTLLCKLLLPPLLSLTQDKVHVELWSVVHTYCSEFRLISMISLVICSSLMWLSNTYLQSRSTSSFTRVYVYACVHVHTCMYSLQKVTTCIAIYCFFDMLCYHREKRSLKIRGLFQGKQHYKSYVSCFVIFFSAFIIKN